MDTIQSSNSVTTAAPPPSEVKIRTMKSDIAMLSSSGGGMPHFANLKVSGLGPKQPETAGNIAKAESKSNLALIIALIMLALALIVVGWFVYLKFGR